MLNKVITLHCHSWSFGHERGRQYATLSLMVIIMTAVRPYDLTMLVFSDYTS